MVMRRLHMIEVARFYQRIENRKREAEQKKSKKGLIKRLFNVK
jgi:hypothetical protein